MEGLLLMITTTQTIVMSFFICYIIHHEFISEESTENIIETKEYKKRAILWALIFPIIAGIVYS